MCDDAANTNIFVNDYSVISLNIIYQIVDCGVLRRGSWSL